MSRLPRVIGTESTSPNIVALRVRSIGIMVLPVAAVLSACASFEPPKYGGVIRPFESEIELPFAPETEYAFTEGSDATIETTFGAAGSAFTFSTRFKLRNELSGLISHKRNADGFAIAVCIKRLVVRPVEHFEQLGVEPVVVRDLRYSGQTDVRGALTRFEVDRTSPGWQTLSSEQKSKLQKSLNSWELRQKVAPETPRTFRSGEVQKIESQDLRDHLAAELGSTGNLTLNLFVKAVGITLFENTDHLIVDYRADLQVKAAGQSVDTMDAGYYLLDVATGTVSYWEQASRAKLRTGPQSITINKRGSGQSLRNQTGENCVAESI